MDCMDHTALIQRMKTEAADAKVPFLYTAAGCSDVGMMIFGVFTTEEKAIDYVRRELQARVPEYTIMEEVVPADDDENVPAHYAFRVLEPDRPFSYEETLYITILGSYLDVGAAKG